MTHANDQSLIAVEERLLVALMSICEDEEATEPIPDLGEKQALVASYLQEAAVKRDQFVWFIHQMEKHRDLLAEDADRKRKRSALLNRGIERLKAYAAFVMQAVCVRKLEGEVSVLRLIKNPPSVEITDASQLAAGFLREIPAPPPEPDKRLIMAALKVGSTVIGAKLKDESFRLVVE